MKITDQSRPVHISWLISALCAGLLGGVALTALTDMSFFAPAIWLLASLFFLAFGLRKRTARFAVFFICAGLILGLWRGSNEQLAYQYYEPHYDKFVTLQGRISEDPSRGNQGGTRLQLVDITINNRSVRGKVWVSTETNRTLKRNDMVTVRGLLEEGFGNMPASMPKSEFVSVRQTSQDDKALQLRDWFTAGIRQAIPEPQASLGAGFLTGEHSSLPAELDDQLKVVGLTHAVVASGSNLTILVGFTRRALLGVSKYTATVAGGMMTAGFVLVAGLSPSMTRAGLVTGLSLAAWYYGRRIHPLVLLPFAAAITVMANPSYLWGDIGWYLSFSAFFGVLILAPLIQSYFWGKDYEPNIIMEIFIGTSAAQIATMPVLLFSFGTYSSYALLANMLVLPLVPIAMLLTFFGGIAGVAIPAIAGLVGWPAAMVMKYMTAVIDWIANMPGAQGEITYGTVALIASYLGMILAALYMRYRTGHKFRSQKDILIGDRA